MGGFSLKPVDFFLEDGRIDKGATNQCNGPTLAYQTQPLPTNLVYYITNQSTNQPHAQPPSIPSACNRSASPGVPSGE